MVPEDISTNPNLGGGGLPQSIIRKYHNTVKPVLSDHSKIVKTRVLKTNGNLMKVESIAE